MGGNRGVIDAYFNPSAKENLKKALTGLAFHFDRDLRDPTLRFLVWLDGELRPAILPERGDTMDIARSLGPAGF